ncbi:Stk1 family PASTA domain-containing Ser/Thr kinase [Janibacter sp. G1551]|uniref:Stk1 family PASTA domain-containing Ser/Thr kinase n=1 Tax=Janibacter sp. G1551 TaxID=3420440 RepID=UPI003D013D9A
MSAPVNSSLVGELIDGRYAVQRHLADGGMAAVYLATDTRLDREVALKVMRPELARDEEFVTRFRREARSIARLSHPHVVQVHDQGEDRGHAFLALEYVPGRTLRQVLTDEGALTPRAALDLLDQILQGLGAAHRAGFVHRDVKPENVLIRDDGMVKVADFGLVRAISSQTATAQSGVVFGTVAYLSPEQVERGTADARSDVYAAGLLLFEMVTGRKAVTGESPIQVAYQHVHGGLPTAASVQGSVPPAVDDLIAHATSRDPQDRPADADALREAVRAVRAHLSPAELDARPTGPAAATASRGAATAAFVPGGATRALGRTGQTSPVAASGNRPPSPPSHSPALRPRRGRIAALLLALTILLGGGGAAWWFTAGPGSTTLVPDLDGTTSAEAAALLEAADLGHRERRTWDEKVAAGRVITSNPASGTEIRRSTTVMVTLSKGPERFRVPDLSGLTVDEAKAALAGENLTAGTTSEEFHEEIAAGKVIRTGPEAGEQLKRGAAVSLVVSKGREPIAVPQVTGKAADEAASILESAGLKVVREDPIFDPQVPKGAVISQDQASATLFRGDTVTLRISKGPEMVTVPDVQGRQEADAIRILKEAGFTVKVERYLGGIFGTVRTSTPGGGTSAIKGSSVTLVVV